MKCHDVMGAVMLAVSALIMDPAAAIRLQGVREEWS